MVKDPQGFEVFGNRVAASSVDGHRCFAVSGRRKFEDHLGSDCGRLADRKHPRGWHADVGGEGKILIFPFGDSHALSAVLLRLISDRDLRFATGMAMQRRAKQHSTPACRPELCNTYGLLAAGQRDQIREISNPELQGE